MIRTEIVVAVAENGVIGRDNGLVWRLGTDLKRFRALTMGHPLVLGRRTFDSIGRPLPGRRTVIVTRDRAWRAEGVAVAHDWDGALAAAARLAEPGQPAMVAGGAEIYRLALAEAAKIHLTVVHARPEGDVRFPDLPPGLFREVARTEHPSGPADEHPFAFVEMERVASR